MCDNGFISVYKRHTPFSIMTQEQIFQGGRSCKILKTGDVILYIYLFTNTPIEAYDWKYVIKSIEYHIGGQNICEWDIEYLSVLSPILMETLYSRISYTNGLNFLPIPVNMLPVKNMRFHEIELVINWVSDVDPTIRCNITFANLSDDEKLPDVTDMIIHQVYQLNLVDGKPLALHGAVKYIVSRDVVQPTYITYNGVKNEYSMNKDLCLYKHTNSYTYRSSKLSSSYSDSFPLQFYPKTCQRLGNFIYIFSSSGKGILKQNIRTLYNSPGAFQTLTSLVDDVTTSVVVDNFIYAAGYSSGKLMRLNSIGNQTLLTNRIKHPVNSIHYYNNRLILMGAFELTDYDITTGSMYSTDDFSRVGTNIQLPLSLAHDVSNLIGTNIIWYSSITKDSIRYDLLSKVLTTYSFMYDISSTINGISFDEYATSLKVGTDSYLLSVKSETTSLVQNFETSVQLPSQTYLTMIHDGSEYIYVYPYIGTIVCRFTVGKGISLFIPFCLNTATPSCGSVYFDNNSELVLSGTGNGIVYAVRYNILRIQNGMAATLYA